MSTILRAISGSDAVPTAIMISGSFEEGAEDRAMPDDERRRDFDGDDTQRVFYERRRADHPWSDVRFIVPLLLTVALSGGGGFLGSYITMRVRESNLEMAAQNLNAKADRIEAQSSSAASEIRGQVTAIAASVQSQAMTVAQLQILQDEQRKQLAAVIDDMKVANLRLNNLEMKQARMEASRR